MPDAYTHGHHESVLRSHRWRTAENSAAYLLPHLRPGVSVLEAATSLVVLTSLYAVLAVIEVKLLVTYVNKGADPFEEPPRVKVGGSDEDAPLTFAY